VDQHLSLQELAQRTGESAERLGEWCSLGLLTQEAGNALSSEDVERVRLIQLLLRRGVALDRIVQADRAQGILGRHVGLVFPDGVPAYHTFAEAAAMAGSSADELRRFWDACMAGEPGEAVSEEDVAMLRGLKAALDAGFPTEALLQMLRVYADALERVAEAEARLFHFYVHERLRAAGLSGGGLIDSTDATQSRLRPLVEPTILYFHRRGVARAAREDVTHHLAEDAGLLAVPDLPGHLPMAVVFVDLSSFTPLAEAMGDLVAAEVLDRFSALVREEVNRSGGRVVKQIGDAFMLVFPSVEPAVECSLAIAERVAAEPQFPAVRGGIHWGNVLYREGDYLGATVNLAARLAAEAGRRQMLVSASARSEVAGLAQVNFVPLGPRRLKGVTEAVELFEVRKVGAKPQHKLVDPVCGMELDPAEVAARLILEGSEIVFCSERCLRRFAAGEPPPAR
jgi:class 3 adenylate cyclase/YHS domain-containing protein